MVTPLIDQDRLDDSGLHRSIEHILGGGVHGLLILGTTGEGPSLSLSVRQELVERACEHVAGRVPILVAVTDAAYGQTRALARHANRYGPTPSLSPHRTISLPLSPNCWLTARAWPTNCPYPAPRSCST
jgi:4-hydroxy-tetrahydrodipicolinate synthase